MRKIFWSYLPDSTGAANMLNRQCLQSWQKHHPDWDCRFLTPESARFYLDAERFAAVQPSIGQYPAALGLLLLHEYGGVWVGPNVACLGPIGDWLHQTSKNGAILGASTDDSTAITDGFFACRPGDKLIDTLASAALASLQNADDTENAPSLLQSVVSASESLAKQVRASVEASGAHNVMQNIAADEKGGLPESIRIAHLPNNATAADIAQGTTMRAVLDSLPSADSISPPAPTLDIPENLDFATLKVSTENLGDHIQILAARRMMSRAGISPAIELDRDDEIHSAPQLKDRTQPLGMLINGWFKTNKTEWPPHELLHPLYMGFHVRLFQCPKLVSDEAIEHYKRFQPIGCRDNYTYSLLRKKGVDAFVSHCLTLSLPKRFSDPEKQTETFVVSRDKRIAKHLPAALGRMRYVCHYSGEHDFEANMKSAAALLQRYQGRAKLIITTLLHCALPAMAMGIPVVMLYPLNPPQQHKSDRERFSSLETLIDIHSTANLKNVNWSPEPVDVSDIKLALIDRMFSLAKRWETL